MRHPVRIEDIEEFELAHRIPRTAITEDILLGVQKLHEIKEIEVFLRDILPDKTDTPHNPTEIADIFTTHVTRLGRPLLATFVNKGKSYEKVTARDITHQVFRLKQIPNLGIMILLAVGNIQDDAKRDFLSIAEDANTDYMIVDAIDVARLFIAYHKICPKDGTPYIDGVCRKCGTPASELIELTIKVYEEPEYTVLLLDEISMPPTKRYRAIILTDKHYSSVVLREVIRKAICEFRKSRYYDSERTEAYFGDRDADCVFLFVCLDIRDMHAGNWRCQAYWIRPDLPSNARPMTSGDDWLGEIQIDWNTNYFSRRDFWASQTVKKEDWLRNVRQLLNRVEAIDDETNKVVKPYQDLSIEQQALQGRLGEIEKKALTLFRDVGDRGWSPPECKDCDDAFINMISSFHNKFVPFATWGQASCDWTQKISLMRMYTEKYAEDKSTFLHEWRKLNR